MEILAYSLPLGLVFLLHMLDEMDEFTLFLLALIYRMRHLLFCDIGSSI